MSDTDKTMEYANLVYSLNGRIAQRDTEDGPIECDADHEALAAADAIEALTEEKERLQGYVSDWRDKCADLERRVGELGQQVDTLQTASDVLAVDTITLTAENERLRAARAEIRSILAEKDVSNTERVLLIAEVVSPQPEGQDNG